MAPSRPARCPSRLGRTLHAAAPACGALALTALLAGPVAARAAEPDETRARMREIFTSMKLLLPLSIGDEFASAERRAEVTGALESLAANADLLAAHAAENDPARDFLGRSLAADARNALERFREDRVDSAAFLVQQTTENCIACHTKRTSAGDSPLATQFVDATALAKLPPEDRARLQMATRQFDDARRTLEGLFADPAVHPAAMLGALTDYLLIAIRVKGDAALPIPTLEKFAKRKDLWVQLRSDVAQWIQDLRELGPLLGQPADLAAARRLVQEARTREPLAPDERSLVRYIVASSLLHRGLEAGGGTPKEQSEAWYLLGVCELQSGDTFWLSQAQFYLETAIRRAPGTPPARRAYELLEAETIESYTGAAGTVLPPALAAQLAELHAIAEGR